MLTTVRSVPAYARVGLRPATVATVRTFTKSREHSMPAGLGNHSTRIFNDAEQRRRLPADVYAALKKSSVTGTPLSKDHANQLARVMQEWAMARGAVSYSHWFAPMRGANAEKHDSFMDLNYQTMDIVVDFNGTKLFRGETDGSSFPNGGLRATHSAAAYTAWDTASPPFVRNGTLFIPSSFISFTGAALDEKTPLLRSQEALSKQGVRLLRAIGDKETQRVICNLGWEQEFFVVDTERYLARPDLTNCSRTLIGNLPPRHQQTEAHYFGRVPPRVRHFLREAQNELWALGISISTLHSEVAPGQHETCPIFSVSNVAADQNALTIEVMNDVAARHGLTVLFHEKPFAKINGSGKHNNWSLNTDTGANLFTPGKNSFEQARFVTFLSALARGMSLHGDVLRVGVAHAGNDHRLGAQEAPPAIISLNLGAGLDAHMQSVLKGGKLDGYGQQPARIIKPGAPSVQDMTAPLEDRNRTAPFPFCGNRFEFRAVGSSQNISFPLTLLNTVMAESMGALAGSIEGGASQREAVSKMLAESYRIVFNGNGYSEEWRDEAKRRGLPNLRNTVEALATFQSDKNKRLFREMGVYSPDELHARTSVQYEMYIKTLKIEAATLLGMMNTSLLPACLSDRVEGTDTTRLPALASYVSNKQTLYNNLAVETEKLQKAYDEFPTEADEAAQAAYCQGAIKDAMLRVRVVADKIEAVLPKHLYPFPTYGELVYGHHHHDKQ